MVRFRGKVDVSSEIFAFPWAGRRVLPNVRPDWSDLLGERFSGKFLNDPLARGFFYVWADKLGTCREDAVVAAGGSFVGFGIRGGTRGRATT